MKRLIIFLLLFCFMVTDFAYLNAETVSSHKTFTSNINTAQPQTSTTIIKKSPSIKYARSALLLAKFIGIFFILPTTLFGQKYHEGRPFTVQTTFANDHRQIQLLKDGPNGYNLLWEEQKVYDFNKEIGNAQDMALGMNFQLPDGKQSVRFISSKFLYRNISLIDPDSPNMADNPLYRAFNQPGLETYQFTGFNVNGLGIQSGLFIVTGKRSQQDTSYFDPNYRAEISFNLDYTRWTGEQPANTGSASLRLKHEITFQKDLKGPRNQKFPVDQGMMTADISFTYHYLDFQQALYSRFSNHRTNHGFNLSLNYEYIFLRGLFENQGLGFNINWLPKPGDAVFDTESLAHFFYSPFFSPVGNELSAYYTTLIGGQKQLKLDIFITSGMLNNFRGNAKPNFGATILWQPKAKKKKTPIKIGLSDTPLPLQQTPNLTSA